MSPKRLEQIDELSELSKKVDYNDLKYYSCKSGREINFSPMTLFNDIIEKQKPLEKAEEEKGVIKICLNKIKIRNKSEKQKKSLANIKGTAMQIM